MRYKRTVFLNGEYRTLVKTDPNELVMANENAEYTLRNCITPPMPLKTEWKPLEMTKEEEE
tara:strand:+ start:56 stop:238 length:183 start_codon:yes stop_codon:yes gene_type:complete